MRIKELQLKVTREVFAGPDVPPALGPYSPAIMAGGMIFVSAQSGVDPTMGRVPDDTFEVECRQAFTNVSDVLKAAGATLADVVKVTVLYSDQSHLEVINAVYEEHFPLSPPARTAAIVNLAGGRRIAVDAVAVAPPLATAPEE